MDSTSQLFSKFGLSSIFGASNVSFVKDGQPITPNQHQQLSPGVNFSGGMFDTLLATAGRSSPLTQVILFLYRQTGTHLGIDPSLIITTLGLFWALLRLFSSFSKYFWFFVDKYFKCDIHISSNDDIHNQIMEWVAKHPSTTQGRHLSAQTSRRGAWDEREDQWSVSNKASQMFTMTDAGQGGEQKYFNFSKAAANSNPRYVPAVGATQFWHNRTYFTFHRSKEEGSTVNFNGQGAQTKDQESIKLACYGRSIRPIRSLLDEARKSYFNDSSRNTMIYRPKTKERRARSTFWHIVARRPIRPMETVVLDPREKKSVLDDINEYLDPATPDWYAARGIPLRRGYLFYGPPGTGKTSFSFALAGVFGLDIYVMSLQDGSITEEDLATAFTGLPRRCIILLEDVDSAGIRRRDDEVIDGSITTENDQIIKEGSKISQEQVASTTGGPPKEVSMNGEMVESGNAQETPAIEKENNVEPATDAAINDLDNAKAKTNDVASDSGAGIRKARPSDATGQLIQDLVNAINGGKSDVRRMHLGRPTRIQTDVDNPPANLSLSGLLNAIDGVASHEGRVLIMTTNKPESLDDALVRPGRVDVQIGFSNASKQQAGDLFRRMYDGLGVSKRKNPIVAEKSGSFNDHEKYDDVKTNGDAHITQLGRSSDALPLDQIAEAFGNLFPENILSPAEIQGFLLKRKTDPRKALADAEPWIKATMIQKREKMKRMSLQ